MVLDAIFVFADGTHRLGYFGYTDDLKPGDYMIYEYGGGLINKAIKEDYSASPWTHTKELTEEDEMLILLYDFLELTKS